MKKTYFCPLGVAMLYSSRGLREERADMFLEESLRE